MPTSQQARFAALVPPGRLISILIAALVAAAVVLPAPAARATMTECQETWDRLTSWSVEVERSGVSAPILSILSDLSSALRDCHDGDSGMGADAEMWRSLAGIYFDPADVDRVMCLMEDESGGNPNARNPRSGAAGLMQVMPSWAGVFGYEVDDLYDPGVNLWISSQILEEQGWGAWSPYLRGSCH